MWVNFEPDLVNNFWVVIWRHDSQDKILVVADFISKQCEFPFIRYKFSSFWNYFPLNDRYQQSCCPSSNQKLTPTFLKFTSISPFTFACLPSTFKKVPIPKTVTFALNLIFPRRFCVHFCPSSATFGCSVTFAYPFPKIHKKAGIPQNILKCY